MPKRPELDHPQSQAVKRERLAAAGLADPPNLHFGTVNFERESVAEALERLPFRPNQPAVFAWLGVTMYLTRAAIAGTWRAMGSVAARGSELVFDFLHPDALSETAPSSVRATLARTRAVGEPIITGIDPGPLGAELEAMGWTLIEHLDAAEIHRRYFATRTDGWRASPLAHLACAGIIGPRTVAAEGGEADTAKLRFPKVPSTASMRRFPERSASVLIADNVSAFLQLLLMVRP